MSRPSGGRWRVVGTLLLVVLLGLQPAVAAGAGPRSPVDRPAGVAPATGEQPDGANDTDAGLGPADHVYVEADGDVVLVIDGSEADATDLPGRDADAGTVGDSTDADGAADDGLDPAVRDIAFDLLTDEGLVYGLLVANRSTVTDTPGTTATLTTTVGPDRFAADGSLGLSRPDRLRELRFDLTGARTTERAGATLDGVVAFGLAGDTAAGRLVERAEADASARFGPRNLTVRANGSADLPPASASLVDPFSYRAVLTEEPGLYRLAVERNTTVAAAATGNWSTRARTRATLERRFLPENVSSVANASLRVRSYEFRNTTDGGRVIVSYTVRYEGVKSRLKPAVTAALASDENVSIGPLRAERLASDLLSVEVERAAVTARYRDGGFEASTRLRLREYDESLGAALDLAAAYDRTENGTVGSFVEGYRKRFEAAREAGLVREYRLGTTYERPPGNEARVTVDGAYRTTNWDAYVAALAERDVRPLNVTFGLHARTDGDRLRSNASVAARRPGLLDRTLAGLRNLSRAADAVATADTELGAGDDGRSARTDSERFVRALARSDLRRARFTFALTEDAARLEGAARFGNLGALEPLLRNDTTGDPPTDLRVTEVVVRPGADRRGVVYVYADGAVPADATASEVRALAAVTDGTTVHLPGTWNREFPRVDRERAYDFLGEIPSTASTPTPTPGEGETGAGNAADAGDTARTTNGAGAGFGPLAALLAVALLALLARRRKG